MFLARGYLKIAEASGQDGEDYKYEIEEMPYELATINQEVVFLFKKLIRGWFHTGNAAYNDFIKALLADNVKAMNIMYICLKITFYNKLLSLSILYQFHLFFNPKEKIVNISNFSFVFSIFYVLFCLNSTIHLYVLKLLLQKETGCQ